MNLMTPAKVAALVAAAALTLSACAENGAGDGSEGDVVTATVTATDNAPTQDTAPPEAAPAPTTDTETETGTPVETVTQTGGPGDAAPADDLPYEPVGSEVTIAGEPSTICIHGDGWGTNVWAGNQNTSCEFVIATHEALIEGLDATEDDVRDHLRHQVEVYSPVTEQEYTLTCAPRNEKLVTCSGADAAAVHFY